MGVVLLPMTDSVKKRIEERRGTKLHINIKYVWKGEVRGATANHNEKTNANTKTDQKLLEILHHLVIFCIVKVSLREDVQFVVLL